MYPDVKDLRIQTCVDTLKRLVSWAEKLGPAWYPVKRDLDNNAKMIETYMHPPFSWKHIGSGFEKELKLKGREVVNEDGSLILSSIWALRGIRTLESFCRSLLYNMETNPNVSMSDSVHHAYYEGLKPHQSSFMQFISSGILVASKLDSAPAWRRVGCKSPEEGCRVLNQLLEDSMPVSIAISVFLLKNNINEKEI